MKKTWILMICLFVTVCFYYGDARAQKDENVLITQTEYENYSLLSELIELMDAVDMYYYREPDHKKMIESACNQMLEKFPLQKNLEDSLDSLLDTMDFYSNSIEDKTIPISREEYERYRQFDAVTQQIHTIKKQNSDIDANIIMQEACRGLLKGLGDDKTFYLDPDEWQHNFGEDNEDVAGIGLVLSPDNVKGICKVIRIAKGSPAEVAGVRKGDILYKVGDDLYVTPENLLEACNILSGMPGTIVNITVLRDEKEITFSLERAQIDDTGVESTMLTDTIGLISLYEFAGDSDVEFVAALKSLVSEGIQGLIIDLRDNTGGWLETAQNICDLFLDAGDFCYIVYRDGSEDHCFPTQDGKIEIPMIILVNENSESASEIFASALQERANATIVGVNTAGTVIVQAVLPVGTRGAGFRITIGEFYTPEGKYINMTGLSPDVEITMEDGDSGGYDFGSLEDPQLKKAMEILQYEIALRSTALGVKNGQNENHLSAENAPDFISDLILKKDYQTAQALLLEYQFDGSEKMLAECNDHCFLFDMTKGLNARWKLAGENIKTWSDKKIQEWNQQMVECEMRYLSKYLTMGFSDSLLASYAYAYIQALQSEEIGAPYYGEDNEKYKEYWVDKGENIAARYVYLINRKYGIETDMAYLKTFEKLIDKGQNIDYMISVSESLTSQLSSVELILFSDGISIPRIYLEPFSIKNTSGYEAKVSVSIMIHDQQGKTIETLRIFDYDTYYDGAALSWHNGTEKTMISTKPFSSIEFVCEVRDQLSDKHTFSIHSLNRYSWDGHNIFINGSVVE